MFVHLNIGVMASSQSGNKTYQMPGFVKNDKYVTGLNGI